MNVTLAKEVKARILAEPKLVNMRNFCTTIAGICGTVGCIAGHAILATGITLKTIKLLELDDMESLGASLLQISKKEAQKLFYFYNDDKAVDSGEKSEDSHPYLPFARQLRKQRAGSQRYAKIVADAIDFAIFRYESGNDLRD